MGFGKNLDEKNTSYSSKIEYEKVPIYPSRVQSTAFPERAYIFAIEKLILISILLFVTSVILGVAIYYKTFLFKPNPIFIYYSDYDKQFKLKPFYKPNSKHIYHNVQVLAEDFLKKWIIDYYSIHPDNDVNNSKWCNCLEKNINNINKKLLDNYVCSICSSSDKNVYNIFFESVKPVKSERYKSGIIRIVKVLNIQPFFYGIINHNQAKKSILEEIALTSISAFKDSLYQESNKTNPFRSYMFYIKVDFMVVDFKNGVKINTEFMTSDNTVGLRLFQNDTGHLGVNDNWTNNFIVMEHSTNFILHNKYNKIDTTDILKQYNNIVINSITSKINNENSGKQTQSEKENQKVQKNNILVKSVDNKKKNKTIIKTNKKHKNIKKGKKKYRIKRIVNQMDKSII